jgi:MinD-like ATPase involved in chromosome partitioning or flagellar assembly
VRHTKVVAVGGLVGGRLRAQVSVNLAAAAIHAGAECSLLVDLDPAGFAHTQVFERASGPGLAAALRGECGAVDLETLSLNLYDPIGQVPYRHGRLLVAAPGHGLEEAVRDRDVHEIEAVVRRQIGTVPAALAVIDAPPLPHKLALVAARLARRLLVPLSASLASGQEVTACANLLQRMGLAPRCALFVLTRTQAVGGMAVEARRCLEALFSTDAGAKGALGQLLRTEIGHDLLSAPRYRQEDALRADWTELAGEVTSYLG